MAGAATDPSRMGITLQDYDQVIALSQANINETLRRHFAVLDAKDELGTFEAEAGTSSITAKVLAPTIELIDEANADGALYVIHLGEGFYSTAVKVGGKYKGVEIPTDGWELAFDIDFAFKPILKIPDHITRQVPLPGGYSVQQLMINFGDITRILQLDPKRSKFSIPDSSKELVKSTSIEAGLELFLREYLKEKLQKRDGHNILGFAVKVDQAPQDLRPEFLPTDSKVQIIGHRSDGQAESFRKDNPYNAFCFTEMTEGRRMPSNEMQYSGNWFYQPIGGTLAMSRTLFWDFFMVNKIKDTHIKAVETSAFVLGMLSSTQFSSREWCIDSSKPSRADICGSYQGSASWGDLAYTTSYKCSELQHWNRKDSEVVNFWFSPRSTVHTLAKPNARKGEVTIQQDLEISWELGVKLSNYFYITPATALAALAFNASARCSLNTTITTTISLKAVPSTGDLQVESNSKTTHKDFKPLKIHIGGLGQAFPTSVHEKINEWAEKSSDHYNEAKKLFETEIQGLDKKFTDLASAMKNDLNNQNKFIFPGSGTFDMKDPIFSDKGDLMLGLTYR